MAPSAPGLARLIPPAHQGRILEPQGGAEPRAEEPRAQRGSRESRSAGRLPEGVGKGYVNAEVTLGLVCTVHTEAQLSRVPAACCKCKDCKKLSKTNNIFILFRFSDHHKQIHAVALAAAPGPSGQVIHHCMRLKHCHTSFLHPSQKQRTVTHEALLPQTDRHIPICPSHISPPVLNPIWDSQPKQLFKSPHWQGTLDKKRRMDIDWTQWAIFNPNKTVAEVFKGCNQK